MGYGDLLPEGGWAKAFTAVYVVVGGVVTAAALADVALFPLEMRRRAHEIKARDPSTPLLAPLLSDPTTSSLALTPSLSHSHPGLIYFPYFFHYSLRFFSSIT